MLKGYSDFSGLDEDERIRQIGEAVMYRGMTVGFIVDAVPADKADRYITKLRTQYPGICIIGRFNGPVHGVVTVKVGPPPIPASGSSH